jgi:ubiquinone biosynthesis protein
MVVEGVARSLDPDFDMWSASEPVIAEWVTRHKGPVGVVEDAAEAMGSIGRLLTAIPVLADRAQRLARESEHLDDVPPGDRRDRDEAEIRRWLPRNAGAAVFWVIAGALIVIAITAIW